jgi:hypothetical protein
MEDREYITVMSELKFISKVGDGEFLNIQAGTIESSHWINKGYRKIMFPNETGYATAEYCKNAILKALKLLTKYEEYDNADEYVNKIKKYMIDTRDAIERLKKTHSNNTKAFTLFDTVQVCIDQRIKH